MLILIYLRGRANKGVSHRGVKDVSDLLGKSVCQSGGLKRPNSDFGAEIAHFTA